VQNRIEIHLSTLKNSATIFGCFNNINWEKRYKIQFPMERMQSCQWRRPTNDRRTVR